MSETCLHDDESLMLSALTREPQVLHHVPRPIKMVEEMVASLTDHYNLKKKTA